MKRSKVKMWASFFCLVLLIGSAGFFLARPTFFVVAQGRILARQPINGVEHFSARFIHSVQKTPVVEHFVADAQTGEIVLLSTEYESFGVGFPFLATDGTFHQKGNRFVLDDINRHFKDLVLRTGVGTNLSLRLRENVYYFDHLIPVGEAVRLYIAPYYEGFLIWREP